MSSHRVLITGSDGLLGQHLVDRLAPSTTREVLACGRRTAPGVPLDRRRYETVDLTRRARVREVIASFRPDTIINCAAMTQVDQCEEHPQACEEVNVRGVAHLVESAEAIGARLVQISTDFVFDGRNGPYREEDAPAPVNVYGASKLAAEAIVASSRLPRWAIARTVLVYGQTRSPGRSNIVTWIVDTLRRGERVRVVTDQWRTPTYVEDLVDGVVRLLENPHDGVYHVGGDAMLSVHEFACRIAAAFDLDASLIEPVDSSTFTQRGARPPRTGLISEKAGRDLGYRPRTIARALEALRERYPPGP